MKLYQIYYISNIRNPYDYYISFFNYRVASFHKPTKPTKIYSHVQYLRDTPNFKLWLRACLGTDDSLGDMTKNVIRYWFMNNREL